jgi:hypothetical protein
MPLSSSKQKRYIVRVNIRGDILRYLLRIDNGIASQEELSYNSANLYPLGRGYSAGQTSIETGRSLLEMTASRSR